MPDFVGLIYNPAVNSSIFRCLVEARRSTRRTNNGRNDWSNWPPCTFQRYYFWSPRQLLDISPQQQRVKWVGGRGNASAFALHQWLAKDQSEASLPASEEDELIQAVIMTAFWLSLFSIGAPLVRIWNKVRIWCKAGRIHAAPLSDGVVKAKRVSAYHCLLLMIQWQLS